MTQNRKISISKSALNYFMIAFGALVFSVGFNIFMVPNKISAGGVTALATTLYHISGIPVSLTNLVANGLLLALGTKILGIRAVLKNIYGVVALSLFLELTSALPAYKEDIFIACLAGGLVMGVGIGLVIRFGASTGGSDFLALIIKKYLRHIPIATLILIIDGVIIAGSGIAFGSITVTIYSAVALYLCSKVTDMLLTLGSGAKCVQIITAKDKEISSLIMKNLNRGVTGIYSKGMYTNEERIMLMCLLSTKQLPALVSLVKSIDKEAFLIISDAKEVLGHGFISANDYQ